MTTIPRDTKFHYHICGVDHEITAQKGSSLLLDEQGQLIVNQSHMKKMNRLFKSWIRFADKYNIIWVCQGGTLLGAARESKGHLPWDDDIDVNVLYTQYDKLYDLCGIHGNYKLEMADSGFNYHRIDEGYPFVDVWVLARQDSRKYVPAGPFTYKEPQFFLTTFWPKEHMHTEDFKNRIKVPFEDYEAYVPANYMEVVKRQFCNDILTNYCYDSTKEIHSQMVHNWIFNNVFSLRNRVIIAHVCYNAFNYETNKYMYNLTLCYVISNMNEKLLNRIVDEFVKEKTYLKPMLMSSIRAAIFLFDPIIKSA